MCNSQLFPILILCFFQFSCSEQADKDYTKSLANYEHYEKLISKVKSIRSERLISFDQLLYGYGYRNIYELDELVDIDDPRVILEGDNGIKVTSFNPKLLEAKNKKD